MNNTPLNERVGSHWASLCAMAASLLGIICFAALTAGSFESTETPAAVIGTAAACTLLGALCFFWKDLFHALSTAAFFASLGALSSFTAGRVSYLAFYFSGDVMGTGLSPLFFLSAIFFGLAVIFSALSMAQPFDKKGNTKAGKSLILAVAAITVIAVVAVAVVRAAVGAPKRSNGNSAATGSVSGQQENNSASTAAAESMYKTPTQDAAYWRERSAAELAAEDVSGKAIAYQFTGHADVNRVVDLLVNLYEDGFARIFQVSNGTLNYCYNGYWRNKDDESIYFGVTNYAYQGEDRPDYNLKHGDVAIVDYSYDLVKENGMFSFGCNFCLGFAEGGQFVRSAVIEGDGTVKFTTEDAFLTEVGAAAASAPVEETEAASEPSEEAPGYPANTMLLTFTPDTSERLTTTFSCDSSVWGHALGSTGSYTPTDSDEVLFSWSNTAESYQLDFRANGTYEYRFTSMNITESGTWTFAGWQLSTTTANGLVATGEIVH